MEIKQFEVLGMDWALKAMRMPYLSQENSTLDKDIALAKKLKNAGREHRKFLRQITIQIDMTASMAFWFEFDTYKVGATSNSESFFFVKGKRPLYLSDFVIPVPALIEPLRQILEIVNNNAYCKPSELRYIVPQGVKYRRIVTISGEAYLNMYNQRKNHRLEEWRDFTRETKELIKDDLLYRILFEE